MLYVFIVIIWIKHRIYVSGISTALDGSEDDLVHVFVPDDVSESEGDPFETSSESEANIEAPVLTQNWNTDIFLADEESDQYEEEDTDYDSPGQ